MEALKRSRPCGAENEALCGKGEVSDELSVSAVQRDTLIDTKLHAWIESMHGDMPL
jgi:hypothetical protein